MNPDKKAILPSVEEDKAICQGIADDPDTVEWTTKQFKQAQAAADILPHLFTQKTSDEDKTEQGLMVLLAPDVAKIFPTANAVNEALRALGKIIQAHDKVA